MNGRALLTPLGAPLAFIAVLVSCSAAHAAFTPATLASGDPALALQADYAYDPAISADGRYVAFTGSVASVPGVYREDIATQPYTLERVADGTDAGAPSISADGRYVSFTSDQTPATGQSSGPGACDSVYVRDMDVSSAEEEAGKQAPGSSGAFTLASARDGSAESLLYQPPAEGESCGAAAAARVAISADGRQVAFTVLSASDLTGACAPAGEPPATVCPTPPDQVVVRDLDTQSTTLVSVTRASLGTAPQPVPAAAALAGQTLSGSVTLANGASARLPIGASTAALSADGGTVAWMGVDIGEQVQLDQAPPTEGHIDGYAEPLWRRIADGPAAPTRRVLAGDDPSAPECPPACPGGVDLDWDTQGISPQEYSGAAPEFGSFTSAAASSFSAGSGLQDELDAVTPQLSADGLTVALLSTQPNYGEDPDFGLFSHTKAPPANAFVVNMSPGLSRAQAITRLTDWASLNFSNTALAAPVEAIAISPDGSRVAFTTERVAFPLAPPALITLPVSQAGASQLYDANLSAGTLALVSEGYDGQPANGGVLGVALSGDGHTLALASGATNLSYGVVNSGSDVYVTEELASPAIVGQQSVSAPPPGPSAEIPWTISATATRSADGSLLLDVSVPGAGRLAAAATATIPSAAGHSRKTHGRKTAKRGRKAAMRGALPAQRGHATTARSGRAPTRRKHTPAHPQRRASAPPMTVVARASTNAGGSGLVLLRLTPAARYGSLVYSKAGLYVTITVTFTAVGHPRLTQTLQASFPRRSPLYDLPPYKLPKPKHKSKHRPTAHRRMRT